MMRPTQIGWVLIAGAVLTVGPTGPSAAQMDLLKSGQGALGGLLGGSAGQTPSGARGAGLSDGQIGSGLKQALDLGAKRAVSTVGRPGGFLDNPQIRIPLPGPLEKVRSGLRVIGAGGLADDLDTRINRAAEQAAPKAEAIFIHAIQSMSIADARAILTGPQDSATQYLKRSSSGELSQAMRPIVDHSLQQAGAVQALNNVTSKASALPFGGAGSVDLTGYVVGKALDGIFLYVGREEAQIRTNPAARSTALLRQVFG